MTRDDIIRMAQEVGLNEYMQGAVATFFQIGLEEGADTERETCAKVAESYEPRCDSCPSGVANAIRAREQQE